MAFDIKCPKCGWSRWMDDKFAGRTFTCPCGERFIMTSPNSLAPITITPKPEQPQTDPFPSINLKGAKVTIPLGRIQTYGGSLNLECEVSSEKIVSLNVFAWDGDGRTNGVYLHLASNEFYQLKSLLTKADELFRVSSR